MTAGSFASRIRLLSLFGTGGVDGSCQRLSSGKRSPTSANSAQTSNLWEATTRMTDEAHNKS
jgi:hypothetical protein